MASQAPGTRSSLSSAAEPAKALEPSASDTAVAVEEADTVITPAAVASNALSAMIACAFFVVLGPLAILINRFILKDLDFPYPVAVSLLGSVVGCVISIVLVHTGLVPLTNASVVTTEFMRKNVLPVGSLGAVSLVTGNFAYMYLSVAFIQMLKAFTPAVTMGVLWMAGVENPTAPVLWSTGAMTFFSTVAAYGELHATTLGLLLMTVSVVAEAFRMLVTQKLFTGKVRFSVVESLYYIGPINLLCLIPLVWVLELPDMIAKQAFKTMLENPFAFFLAGLSGGLVSFASNFVIKTTSSLTLKILSAARNAALVLFCALVLGESVTLLQGVFYSLSLAAFVVYSLYAR